jgi:hypothetical protein
MRLVRTMLAFAIAISLAMLPVGASAAGHAMPSDGAMHMASMDAASMHMASMNMAADTDMSMDDCCPDAMKGKPTADHKCGMGLCCAGGLALDHVRAIVLGRVAIAASKIAIPRDQVVALSGSSPPFRPPRA